MKLAYKTSPDHPSGAGTQPLLEEWLNKLHRHLARWRDDWKWLSILIGGFLLLFYLLY